MWYLIDIRIMGFSRIYSIYARNEPEAIERVKIHVPALNSGIAIIDSITIDTDHMASTG